MVLDLCHSTVQAWVADDHNRLRATVRGLIEAVAFLHSTRICHLDIKPDNYLVDLAGGVRAADFGTARSVQMNQKVTGNVGTQGFKAPEVEGGGSYCGIRADCWSLGATLQVLATVTQEDSWRELSWMIKELSSEEPQRRPTVNAVQCTLFDDVPFAARGLWGGDEPPTKPVARQRQNQGSETAPRPCPAWKAAALDERPLSA